MGPDPALTLAVLLLALAGVAAWGVGRADRPRVSPPLYRRLVRWHVGHIAGGVGLVLLLVAIVVRVLRGGP